MENLFEVASRNKIRFNTNKGQISVEDLWDLSLTDLDKVAKAVSKALKEDTEESFIKPATRVNTELTTKLELVKHVISVRLGEQEARKKAAEKASQIAVLEDLLMRKQLEQLESLDAESIKKQLAELKGQ